MSPSYISAEKVLLAESVRRVGPVPRSGVLVPEVDRLKASQEALEEAEGRVEQLREQVRHLERQLQQMDDLASEREAAALAKGRAEGEAQGIAKVVERSRQRDEHVLRGVEAGLGILDEALRKMEAIAAPIALAAAEQVVGDVTEVKKRVIQVMRRQLGRLKDRRPLQVRVAAEDFSEIGPLVGMLSEAGMDGVEVVADPALPSGSCLFKLRVGQIDAGIQQQIRAIKALVGG